MSVRTEIDRIITAVHAAHEKVAEKGGTTAPPYLVANLADAIDTIPTGGGGDTGGGSGAYVGQFASITDNGMWEPGVNEYIFDYSNCDVDLSAATCILMGGHMDYPDSRYSACAYKCVYGYNTFSDGQFVINSNLFTIDQTNKIMTVYGSISSYSIGFLGFRAYF